MKTGVRDFSLAPVFVPPGVPGEILLLHNPDPEGATAAE